MFTDADRQQILDSQRVPEEVERQVRRLGQGAAWTRLDRPATVGDGIQTIGAEDRARYERLARQAAADGRLSAFVPASGAGSRLFESLLRVRAEGFAGLTELRARRVQGDRSVSEPILLLEHFDQLALWPLLAERGCTMDDPRGIVDTLFGAGGLAAQTIPKGLLPFHAYEGHTRTAFEEHLWEAARLCAVEGGAARLHFTVSDSRLEQFRELRDAVAGRVGAATGVSFEVDFSTPDPRTDTVAINDDGEPVRDARGRLFFRPGGHGGLIGNLAAWQGDVVLLKNVDNVFPTRTQGEVVAWRRLVAGMLLEVEGRVHQAIRQLRQGRGLDEALALLADTFGLRPAPDTEDLAAFALDRLRRPLRVCGMIINQGQPGGGPFWVPESSGLSTLQIVEGAQIDQGDPAQAAILAASTHFNPVDIAASVRDEEGRPYDLLRFVDPEGVIITRKSKDGRPISVYEHPGLWNAAMARWNTLFVEVPAWIFNPVKRLGDLLQPTHRGR